MDQDLREQVLAEIRRLYAIDKKPPGQTYFARVTGLPIRKLIGGKPWLNWTQALIEAGCPEGNERVAKLDTDVVFAHLADMTRYFGHLPTQAGIRYYGTQHTGSPAWSTLFDHLGVKSGWKAQLRDWLLQKPEFSDVLELIGPKADSSLVDVQSASIRGYVYLHRHGQTSEYKIGFTEDLSRRISEIDRHLPQGAVEIHRIPTANPGHAESFWKKVFEDKQIRKGTRAEWFRLTTGDVKRFKACKSM